MTSLATPRPAAPKEPGPNGPHLRPEVAAESIIPALTGADRCESCNQAAQSAWMMTPASLAPLFFCGHHTRRHLAKLQADKPFASLISPGVVFP